MEESWRKKSKELLLKDGDKTLDFSIEWLLFIGGPTLSGVLA